MTEMYDMEILEALQTATIDAVAQSDSPQLPVAYLGRAFTKPNDGKWLEVVFVPNNGTNDFWGNEKNYRGLYRLILHWPKNDSGVYKAGRMLASIVSYFSKDRPLQNVQISGNPDLTGVLTEPSEMLFPASIRYQCFRR